MNFPRSFDQPINLVLVGQSGRNADTILINFG